MKKSNFVVLVMGTVSGVLFALGMCMALLPEWNAFREGVAVTAVGGFVLLILISYSIGQEQRTVDLRTMENPRLTIHGRHDPCIVPRAVPVIEAAAACALYDAFLCS